MSDITCSNIYHPFIDSFGATNASQGNEAYINYWSSCMHILGFLNPSKSWTLCPSLVIPALSGLKLEFPKQFKSQRLCNITKIK